MESHIKLLLGMLTTVVGTIIVWAITNIILFFIRKHRLKQAILIDIDFLMLAALENKNFLELFCERQIKESNIIEYSVHYTKEKLDFYKSMHSDLIKFIDNNTLQKIIKFYNSFQAMEALMEGFFKDITIAYEKKVELEKRQIDYLKAKANRIIKLCESLSNRYRIGMLDALPDDYIIIPPSTIIK
jgi:hypothetical protein